MKKKYTSLDKSEAERIAGAIFQVLYIDPNYPETITRRGTCFLLYYKNNYFLLTASHCLNNEFWENLYIANFSTKKRIQPLPLIKMIESYIAEGTKVDTDIRIFLIDMDFCYKEILKESRVKSPEVYVWEIFKTPLIQKLFKKYSKNPIKLKKKITNTKLFSNLNEQQNIDIKNKIKHANTSLSDIGNLALLDNNLILCNKKCTFFGYPTSKGVFEYGDYGELIFMHQHIQNYSGIITDNIFEKTDTYSIIYNENADFDGFSGGPVIIGNKVVGIITEVAKKEKLLKFVSYKTIRSILDLYINQYLIK